MKYSTQVKSISYLKDNAAEVLRDLNRQRRPLVITQNGEARAVIQDVVSYEETQATLALLKILSLGSKQVEEGKVVVLVIDEGQKLTPTYIETIRTLLNFETNEFKLLQVIILGQLELMPKLRRKRNFMDRINLSYMINPLSLEETKQMVHYRLGQAGVNGKELFTDEAIALIHDHSKGSPRKITLICHHALESLIMKDRSVVEADLIESYIASEVF